MSQYLGLTLAAVMGISSHLLFFINGEHHMQAPRLLLVHLAAFPLLVILFFWHNGNAWCAIKESILITATYSSSLAISIIIYRLFFHQLREYPGPMFARITKFWHVAKLISKPNFLLLDELHNQYGDIVRTGEVLRLQPYP